MLTLQEVRNQFAPLLLEHDPLSYRLLGLNDATQILRGDDFQLLCIEEREVVNNDVLGIEKLLVSPDTKILIKVTHWEGLPNAPILSAHGNQELFVVEAIEEHVLVDLLEGGILAFEV